MKVIITGASGLLGRAVTQEFTKAGHEGQKRNKKVTQWFFLKGFTNANELPFFFFLLLYKFVGTALSRANKAGLVKVMKKARK